MPAITGSSLGYAGEINELTGKNYWNRIGAGKYGVSGANDLKVSKTTGDRMLLISSGVAWGYNIEDTLQTAVSVQLNSVSSGSRWDMVVVRRDVTAGTTIEVVQGTSAKSLPSLTSAAASHPDQPLALCRVTAGSTTVEEIIDLRVWASIGGAEVADKLALEYLKEPGSAVKLGAGLWRYEKQANNVWDWKEYRYADPNSPLVRGGYGVVKTIAGGFCTVGYKDAFPGGTYSAVANAMDPPGGAVTFKFIKGEPHAASFKATASDGKPLENVSVGISYIATGY